MLENVSMLYRSTRLYASYPLGWAGKRPFRLVPNQRQINGAHFPMLRIAVPAACFAGGCSAFLMFKFLPFGQKLSTLAGTLPCHKTTTPACASGLGEVRGCRPQPLPVAGAP